MPGYKSFFNLFNYFHLEDGANDALYIYVDCEILRDIDIWTSNGQFKLTKGDSYEAIWFHFKTGEFEFITQWVSSDPNNKDHYNRIPGEGSMTIKQDELAPYLVWIDIDLPKKN